jgi:hypothetical protein
LEIEPIERRGNDRDERVAEVAEHGATQVRTQVGPAMAHPAPFQIGAASQYEIGMPPQLRPVRELAEDDEEGWLPEEWKHELRRLSDRQVELEATIATRGPEPALPTFHPSFFKLKVKQLAAVLNATNVEERETARQAVRNLIDRIEIPPGDALLQVVGNVEGLLAAAEGRDGQRLPVKLVAGAGNQRYLQLWSGAA